MASRGVGRRHELGDGPGRRERDQAERGEPQRPGERGRRRSPARPAMNARGIGAGVVYGYPDMSAKGTTGAKKAA